MNASGGSGTDLSIVIVSWNTRRLLADCLASLPDACGSLSTEIIVVDNASRDGSDAMIESEFPDVRLIRSGGNLGFSRGNNLGLEQTRGRWVLLLNPDTVCPAGSLARLVDFAVARQAESPLGAVGPRLVGEDGRPVISYGWFPALRFHWLEFLDPLRLLPGRRCRDRVVHFPAPEEDSHPVQYVMGACLLMPRDALEEIGPLDDHFFMYFEETDWCLRAVRAGRTNWFCGETEVAHLEGRSSTQVSRFAIRQFQKSYRLFLAKHHGPGSVGAFRLAQACEYGAKALFRGLLPADRRRNEALAAGFAERFRLQLRGQIDVDPPT